MMQRHFQLYVSVCLLPLSGLQAQMEGGSVQDSIVVAAGEEYHRSGLYRLLWGSNWRGEWTVPVNVPVVSLDTLYGGLTPYQKGGGNETNSLRLRTASGKEYVIRSINKSRKDVTPGLLKHTMVATIIQDNVSMSHPYAALALPVMLQHAGIYHTNPVLVYLNDQPALDTFNTIFANDLYILEERPDGDWSDAPHLGGFKKYYSTLDMLEALQKDQTYQADKEAYIRARLFDVLVGDWDKHHDNWRWGKDDARKMFVPIPRDRDQAMFTRNGILNRLYISLSGLKFMQTFGYKIKSVSALTSQDRKMDLVFATGLKMEDWLEAATYLQHRITDSVIIASISQLPAAVFAVSGKSIIEKLKARRDSLHLYAQVFYATMEKEKTIKRKNDLWQSGKKERSIVDPKGR